MSIWVRAIVSRPSDDDLAAGIARRLRLLTYLYCPDDEEDPDDVLAGLSVAAVEPESVWHIRFGDRTLRVERWTGRAAREEIAELPGSDTLAERLSAATDSYAIQLRPDDRETMAWPVAVALAAHLADVGNGLVHAETAGWLQPTVSEVDVLLAE